MRCNKCAGLMHRLALVAVVVDAANLWNVGWLRGQGCTSKKLLIELFSKLILIRLAFTRWESAACRLGG